MPNTVVSTVIAKGKSLPIEFLTCQDGLSRIEEEAVNPIAYFERKVKQGTLPW